jgi:hypothetical protein
MTGGLVVGIVVLFTAMDVDASAEIVTVPLLLIGLGMGALASQLGSVTVSAVSDDESAEVGGLQTPRRTSVPHSAPPSPVRS